MGQTLAEKVISQATGTKVYAGEVAVCPLDIIMIQDGTGMLAVQEFKRLQEAGFSLAKPDRTLVFLDHAAPSPRIELATDHIHLRKFAWDNGAVLYEIGAGVCHQILVEKWVRPGVIVLGADSHTCTSGALGALGTGMGSTDVAVAMALGQNWLRVPETIRVELKGRLPEFICGKDIILHLAGILGSDGATYKVIEFGGPAAASLPIADRFTLCNMAVELGGKSGMFASDSITREYLKQQGREHEWAPVEPDSNARYSDLININLDKFEPMIAKPHSVDNVCGVSEVAGTKVEQIFLGSCTNGRLEDLAVAASILRGKKLAASTRMIVMPASPSIYKAAMKSGYIDVFIDAGALVLPPGCGPCSGVHMGILGDGETCLSTTNRNFKGRMGNPTASIYLSSPAVAAASALTGVISHPKEVL